MYGEVREEVAHDVPTPKGKRVVLSTYKDANLYHDMVSGKSVSGVLHFINKTPIEWFSKKQATVETATYGSEFASAKTAVQQITGLRVTLRYLGVPVHGGTYLFGDNESVVNSSSITQAKLNKRHNALSYHRTREAIASGMLRFHYVQSEDNPADMMSKHWDYASIRAQIRPLLFWGGDTVLIAAYDQWKKLDSAAKEAAEKKRLASSSKPAPTQS